METRNNTYLKPIGSLQLIAIITVVFGHFAIPDSTFMNSHWVSFCFLYSGFFTAMHHRFGSGYGLRDHAHFMWDKFTKLYPLHLLAIALGIFDNWYVWGSNTISLKALFAQLTMISPWIPDVNYYFAFNPVAWFICDLFFLYLAAPLVVRFLRRFRPMLQVIVIVLLLILEFLGGYTPSGGKGSSILGMYMLYEFPPIRLLDFALGVILYNLTQESWWKHIQSRVTAANATIIEASGVLLFVLVYFAEKSFLFSHCYRAFCVMATSIVVLMATFLLTSATNGLLSRALSWKPISALTAIGAEIYLLQFDVFYLMTPTSQKFGINLYCDKWFFLYFVLLLIISWLVHHFYSAPIKKRLLACRDKIFR